MSSYKKVGLWLLIAAVISCTMLAVVFLTNPTTDDSDSSSVFNIADADLPENVVIIPNEKDVEKLREKYPEYFEFEQEDLVDVYIWQNNDESYRGFAFKQTAKDTSYDESALISSRFDIAQAASVAPIEDLKFILAYRWISRGQIRLIPTANPETNNYTYVELDGDAKEQAEAEFWKGYGNVSYIDSLHYIIDSTEYDFDGDGVKEKIAMIPGPTSGIHTFVINISSGHRNTFFVMDYSPDKFVVTEEGCFLQCSQRLSGDNAQSRLYKITIEKGTIVMRYGDEPFGYWGI